MKTKATFENTNVKVIDLESLSKAVSADIGEPAQMQGFGGLITEPKLALIDTEIVAREFENGTIELEIYPADTERTDEKGVKIRSMAIFPKWKARFELADLEPHVKETVTLAEYTKDRRGYNSRLIGNERAVTNWLNK